MLRQLLYNPRNRTAIEESNAKPPIKVWDELEGIPNHQVNKFQHIAAITPAK
jgi:hypothetical protein